MCEVRGRCNVGCEQCDCDMYEGRMMNHDNVKLGRVIGEAQHSHAQDHRLNIHFIDFRDDSITATAELRLSNHLIFTRVGQHILYEISSSISSPCPCIYTNKQIQIQLR